MFLGRCEHAIDEKGRITIPVRYRELLADGAFVCQGFDKNLMVLTAANFERISERVSQTSLTDPASRQLRRLIFSSAERCEFDRAGRLLLPQFLREYACLLGEAILIGVGSYFEIWSPPLWLQQNQALQDAETTAEQFADLDLPI